MQPARTAGDRRNGFSATGLDAWLPSFTVRERHERLVDCAPDAAVETALRLPVAPDWIVRTLFRLRGYGAPRESIAEFVPSSGFVVLDQTPTTYVFGMAARLRGGRRLARDPADWRTWSPPGVKIVVDFRAEAAGVGHSRLSTETRVLALDGFSRLVFRLYWLVVGPFSALIRRRWLRAIAAQAGARA